MNNMAKKGIVNDTEIHIYKTDSTSPKSNSHTQHPHPTRTCPTPIHPRHGLDLHHRWHQLQPARALCCHIRAGKARTTTVSCRFDRPLWLAAGSQDRRPKGIRNGAKTTWWRNHTPRRTSSRDVGGSIAASEHSTQSLKKLLPSLPLFRQQQLEHQLGVPDTIRQTPLISRECQVDCSG